LKPEQREELVKIGNDAGSMVKDELDKVIAKWGMKAPETNNDLSEAHPFNLMFET
jgi:glycyl-tRNA synthetase (class II)